MRLKSSLGLVVVGLCCLAGGELFAAPKDSSSKVKVNVTAEKPGTDGNQTITIDLDIEKGWHAYANPVGDEMLALIATKVTITGSGKLGDVKIDYPKGNMVMEAGTAFMIYEGKVQIKATVKRAKDDGPLTVKVKFSACDKDTCLSSATVEKKVE